jgi:hypothetical protein
MKRFHAPPLMTISDLSADALSRISEKNENPNLAGVSQTFKERVETDMKKTKEFATCVKQITEGNEMLCLERARAVKYPLKCVDFCKLRNDEKDCERHAGDDPKQGLTMGHCSAKRLMFEYPFDRFEDQYTSNMKFNMLLFAQGNRQMGLRMKHTPIRRDDEEFIGFLRQTSSYNPLACVEFPCYSDDSDDIYRHHFPSADHILRDLKFLVQANIRFKSVIIYHYPAPDPYDPHRQEVNAFTLNEDEIKDTIDTELSRYMESLFPNTLQTFLAASVNGYKEKTPCGGFPGPCIILMYGNVTGYSYAQYISGFATETQNEELERAHKEKEDKQFSLLEERRFQRKLRKSVSKYY